MRGLLRELSHATMEVEKSRDKLSATWRTKNSVRTWGGDRGCWCWNLKAQEPGVLKSKGRRNMDIPAPEKIVNLPFLYLFVLSWPLIG